jgi:hypothetical protein
VVIGRVVGVIWRGKPGAVAPIGHTRFQNRIAGTRGIAVTRGMPPRRWSF